nr:OmpA family protein [Allomuricauda sp.]|tara:strand:- start:537 stop:1622 length:1086 start_codon:yes stop_codon:yes gene_type:complete
MAMKIWILVFLFSFSVFTFSQNLVKNPSFEEFVECPNSLGTFNEHVVDWSTPTKGTTDYFNSCSIVMGAPENFNGIQHPKYGNAYAGLYFFAPADYREYVQVELSKMLEKNKTYRLKFYISLAEGSDFAVKDFGVLFSYHPIDLETKKHLSKGRLYSTKGNKMHFFEINHPEFHQDKTDWLEVQAEFRAKGFERYLTLGNFRDNAGTRKIKTKRRETKKGAYYYIDMVTVSGEEAGPPEDESFAIDSTYAFKNVHFDFDSHRLSPDAEAELEEFFDYLQKKPAFNIEIHAHTDNRGSHQYNMALSQRRANAIVAYLIGLGLSKERVALKGYGSAKPIADNATDDGRQQNRRAEFLIKKGAE